MLKKHSLFILFLLIIQTAQAQYDVLIKNITVIPMNENTVLKNTNVGIIGEKIVFIGKIPKRSKAKQTIDGTGKYLMPGLYDMHVHWTNDNPDRYFQLQTLAGITSDRIMKSESATIAYRKKNATNDLVPQLHIGFPIYQNDSMNVAQVADRVAFIKKEGYDFIKIFSIKNDTLFNEVMRCAKLNQLTVCGHPLQNVKAEKLIESGYRSIEHIGLERVKSAMRLDSLLDLVVKNQTFICPTLDWVNMVYHSYPQEKLSERSGYALGKKLYEVAWDTTYKSLAKQLSAEDAKRYADYMSNDLATKIKVLQKMVQKNVTIIAGSDAEEPYQTPGFALIEELKLIQQSGLNNYELLKTCTANAARFFKEEQLSGTIEPNKQANLIVLTKNPLEDIKNLESVTTIIKSGKVIEAADVLKMIK